MLVRDTLLLNFWRNVELRILFCDIAEQDSLSTAAEAFHSFIHLGQKERNAGMDVLRCSLYLIIYIE